MFLLKFKISYLTKFNFPNAAISFNLLYDKFNSFNSLKLTFSNVCITDNSFLLKSNLSNLLNFTF